MLLSWLYRGSTQVVKKVVTSSTLTLKDSPSSLLSEKKAWVMRSSRRASMEGTWATGDAVRS